MSCKLQNVNTFIFFCWSNHRFSFQFRRWQHLCTLKLKITTTYVHQLASVVNAAGFIEHTQASEIPTVMKEAPFGFWIWAGPDRPHPCLPVTHTHTHTDSWPRPKPLTSPLIGRAEGQLLRQGCTCCSAHFKIKMAASVCRCYEVRRPYIVLHCSSWVSSR